MQADLLGLRYIRWEGGRHPQTLTDADLVALSFFSGFASEAYRLADAFLRRPEEWKALMVVLLSTGSPKRRASPAQR